jgi:hypothetical protein
MSFSGDRTPILVQFEKMIRDTWIKHKMQRSILLQRDVVGELVLRMVQAVVDSTESVKVNAVVQGALTL